MLIDPEMFKALGARSWSSRATGVPAFPVGGTDYVSALRTLATKILDLAPAHFDEEITWPEPARKTTVRKAISGLGSCGVFRRDDGNRRVMLTEEAQRWIASGDDTYLIAILHAHAKFFGEILYELSIRGLTHEELQGVAKSTYALEWASMEALRKRTTWLRAAGVIELRHDRRLSLTPLGMELLPKLNIISSESLTSATVASHAVEVPEASPLVRTLISSLDDSVLRQRKASIGLFPRLRNADVVESLRALIGACIPTIEREDLVNYCAKEFGVQQSTVVSTISALKGAGLFEQIDFDTFAASAYAKAWIESGDDLELIRVFHGHILYFGEILETLAIADRAPVMASLAARSYGMPRSDTGGIRTRLQLLRAVGLIEECAHTKYRITPLGDAFRKTVPMMSPLPDEPAGSAEHPLSSATDEDAIYVDRPQIDTVSNKTQLADELLEAAQDSNHPQRFEIAIVKALRALGVMAEHEGRPGHTDIIADMGYGAKNGYRVIIDAKTSGSGIVTENRINFDTLAEHKKKHAADHVAVMGPSFDGGRLQERAEKHGVVLVSAAILAECVRRQQRTPLTLQQVRALFDRNGSVELAQAWDRSTQEAELVTRILATLLREAAIGDTVSGGRLSPANMYYMLRNDMEVPPSIEQIEATLNLLASPMVRGVQLDEGSYVAAEHPSTTAMRLRVLAEAATRAASLIS